MYDPKLYIVPPTITWLVLQVFEVLEVQAPRPPPPPPHPLFGNLLQQQNIYLIHTYFNAGLFRPMQYI